MRCTEVDLKNRKLGLSLGFYSAIASQRVTDFRDASTPLLRYLAMSLQFLDKDDDKRGGQSIARAQMSGTLVTESSGFVSACSTSEDRFMKAKFWCRPGLGRNGCSIYENNDGKPPANLFWYSASIHAFKKTRFDSLNHTEIV